MTPWKKKRLMDKATRLDKEANRRRAAAQELFILKKNFTEAYTTKAQQFRHRENQGIDTGIDVDEYERAAEKVAELLRQENKRLQDEAAQLNKESHEIWLQINPQWTTPDDPPRS